MQSKRLQKRRYIRCTACGDSMTGVLSTEEGRGRSVCEDCGGNSTTYTKGHKNPRYEGVN